MLVQAYYKSPHYRSGEMFGSSVHVDERVDDINRRDVIGLAAQRIQPSLPTRQVLSLNWVLYKNKYKVNLITSNFKNILWNPIVWFDTCIYFFQKHNFWIMETKWEKFDYQKTFHNYRFISRGVIHVFNCISVLFV